MNTVLGVGVVWWPELDPLCRPCEGLVQAIEAEPETFWVPCAGSVSGFASRLASAVGHLPQPKLLHGVGAPFGGGAAQSAAHRQTLASDIAAIRPAWISDHLSFNQFTPVKESQPPEPAIGTGFFLPPLQSAQGVAQAAAHIRQRRITTGVPVAFENPVSYLPPLPGEFTDGVFAARVAQAADCGILLDLHNLLCNERNGRQSVRAFCDALPLERVWEIHVAGGESERGFWLDAHSGLVEPALMDILADIVPRLPALGALMFEILPECVAAVGLAAIGKMLGRLNEIWATRGTAAHRQPAQSGDDPGKIGALPVAVWEHALGASVSGAPLPALPAAFARWMRGAAAPLDLYRFLAGEGRASALVSTAPHTITALLLGKGEAETRALLARFWCHAGPAYTSAAEAALFLDFTANSDTRAPGLAAGIAADRLALARFDRALQLV